MNPSETVRTSVICKPYKDPIQPVRKRLLYINYVMYRNQTYIKWIFSISINV